MDKKEGRGKYTFANGDVYDGEWKADKRHGHGELVCVNGNCYKGERSDILKMQLSPLVYRAVQFSIL